MSFGKNGGKERKQRRKKEKNYTAIRWKGREIMAKRKDDGFVNEAVKELLDKEANPTEIKNCPFCGGHASFSVRNQSTGTIIYAKCECDDCHAVVGVNQAEFADFLKELCVAKWNRRIVGDAER